MSFDPLWKTMKEKNVSTYKIAECVWVQPWHLQQLKQNRNVTLQTIEQLCKILQCRVEDVVEYVDDTE